MFSFKMVAGTTKEIQIQIIDAPDLNEATDINVRFFPAGSCCDEAAFVKGLSDITILASDILSFPILPDETKDAFDAADCSDSEIEWQFDIELIFDANVYAVRQKDGKPGVVKFLKNYFQCDCA